MAITLTAEEDTPQIKHYAILRYIVEIPHKLNATQDDIIIDKDNVSCQYTVVSLDTTRKVIDKAVVNVPFSEWPAQAKLDASSLLDLMEKHAQSNGHIAAGTQEPL